MEKISSAAFTDTKPHYDLLDGLRGVAALMVIWYHVFEGFAFASAGNIETLNHGYLAVDFFFILSGFVIGYAYDDRWGKNFTMKECIGKIWISPLIGYETCYFCMNVDIPLTKDEWHKLTFRIKRGKNYKDYKFLKQQVQE
jgi:hypothetical protein